MCGIHAIVSIDNVAEISPGLKQLLLNRGPDYCGSVTRQFSCEGEQDLHITLSFTSTVLALRGDHIARQPFEDAKAGSVLCWNGEAWKIDGQVINGNDGEVIFAQLTDCSQVDPEHRKAHILKVLRSIEGPFAFLYYDGISQCLFFGRDRLGRRSLLVNRASNNRTVTFSSIADTADPGWKEVEADGVYTMRCCFQIGTSGLAILGTGAQDSKEPWLSSGEADDLVSSIGRFNMSLPNAAVKLDFTSPSVSLLKHHLLESLKLRLLNIPEPPNPQSAVDIRVAVLFSGGLDCTVLARLADEVLPKTQGIDLINVAFENPRVATILRQGPDGDSVDVYEKCPDRITGRKAFAELQAACPSRYWRFIAVNVPFEEAMRHKARVVSLIYPHDTEMDLSIALALYFAGRGIGNGFVSFAEDETPLSTTTPARVLVSGLGADELFGGYSRHVSAFERRQYAGLVDELKLDVSRIGQRNLGRDDRVLAHWGKEVRFPFLDENFIRFAIDLPAWDKCDFENKFHPAVIEPGKRVLRLLADQLSLPSIAREKKRAIQFGSRTAKIESATGRVRGTAHIVNTNV